MFEHRPADRVPVIDGPWATTIERWHREGMPAGVSHVDFFGLDKVASVSADNGPRWTEELLEQTEEYTIVRTSWGVTLKNWRHIASTPEYLDFRVKDAKSWLEAKRRMTPDPDRIDWDYLAREYPRWESEGWWIQANLWFGFDITHSWFVGTETVLFAMAEEPEWCREMFEHELDVHLALFDQVLAAGYRMQAASWPDDMGYKHSQFFSLDTYRRVLKPVHARAIEWAHRNGMVAHLHSCGDVNPFIPELLEIGLDGLNPLEVKAGMDPVELKRRYGDRLVLQGGINAVLWNDLDAISAEMHRVVPLLKENGGYVFSSDHSVPDSVSLENFRRIVELAKVLGSYER
jgi:uroporphyrinogen decarboxylase